MMELSTRTLGDWLEHWALTTPNKEYIVYSDRNLRFTWKQFNERVDHMAKGQRFRDGRQHKDTGRCQTGQHPQTRQQQGDGPSDSQHHQPGFQ